MTRSDIRKFYADLMPEIEACPPYLWAVQPYAASAVAEFTPIEAALWSDLREEGAVMYPQFPVGCYFVDFGNPAAKVAIECDGEFHKLQREADAERQRDIEARGWTVFRLSGSNCLRNGRAWWESDEQADISPAVRLIREISADFPICARLARRMPDCRVVKLEDWNGGAAPIVQCMGGWCRSRESCAHYTAPEIPGRPPAERLCERGKEQPVRRQERGEMLADPRFAQWVAAQ